jgi:hypothetical protein
VCPRKKRLHVSSAVGQCVSWTMCPLAKGGHKLHFKYGDESVWVSLRGCGPPFDPITSMRSVQGLDTSVRDESIKGRIVQRTEHQRLFVRGRIREDTSSHHPKKGPWQNSIVGRRRKIINFAYISRIHSGTRWPMSRKLRNTLDASIVILQMFIFGRNASLWFCAYCFYKF